MHRERNADSAFSPGIRASFDLRVLAFLSPLLKRNSIVHPSALGTPRAVHIGVISINVTAATTAEDAILTGRGFKAAPTQLRVDCHACKPTEQHHHVS
jgi:hypothetical protein